MSNDKLFVYGTLRPENQEEAVKATINGKLYKLGRFPGAVPSENEEDIIVGNIVDVKEGFTGLDRYEGYFENHEERSLFIRRQIKVKDLEGKPISAWIYWYNRKDEVDENQRIKSGDWFNQHTNTNND